MRLRRSEPVAVLLLDIRMPELDGLAATRQITRAGPRPRVIVLTTFNVDSYVVDAVAAGAAGSWHYGSAQTTRLGHGITVVEATEIHVVTNLDGQGRILPGGRVGENFR